MEMAIIADNSQIPHGRKVNKKGDTDEKLVFTRNFLNMEINSLFKIEGDCIG